MNFFIDIDDTLTKSSELLCKMYEEFHGERVYHGKLWRYDMTDVLPKLKDGELVEYFEDDLFYQQVEFFEDAIETLNELANYGHKIILLTHGSPLNNANKLIYLSPRLPFDHSIITMSNDIDKSIVDKEGAYFVDDKVENLKGNGTRFCFKPYGETEYNQDWVVNSFSKWSEFRQYVREFLLKGDN